MAGFKSDYWSNKILGLIFGATAVTPPATLYCALFTVIPSPAGTGGTEVSGSGYARVAVTNNTTNFPSPTAQQVSNATVIDFGTPSGGGWGTIVAGGWYDAATGGNLLYAGPFSPARVGTAGLNFFIPIGGFIGTEGYCS
jgi:hypothetical protein